MGHRALVAYRRPDHLYDVRYSHWGGDDLSLAHDLRPASPLGDGAVEPGLLVQGIALERVLLRYLDPCVHEGLYLVPSDFDVTAYRVCWLGWGDGGRGALVHVDPIERDPEVRVWFRATKTVLADVVDAGVLSRRAALAYLEARVCEDEDAYVYTYAGGGGRERAVRPGRDDRQ